MLVGDTESLSWAFDGIPEKSVLSITTQGCLRNGYLCKQSLLNGLHELIRIKKPENKKMLSCILGQTNFYKEN